MVRLTSLSLSLPAPQSSHLQLSSFTIIVIIHRSASRFQLLSLCTFDASHSLVTLSSLSSRL